MKNKPMISVIVPVYNVEKYIKKGHSTILNCVLDYLIFIR